MSFNGRLRQECVNQHWYLSFEDGASSTLDRKEFRASKTWQQRRPSFITRRVIRRASVRVCSAEFIHFADAPCVRKTVEWLPIILRAGSTMPRSSQ